MAADSVETDSEAEASLTSAESIRIIREPGPFRELAGRLNRGVSDMMLLSNEPTAGKKSGEGFL
jgi:hypothetical protein